ncbi:MAG: hypothetical protein AAFU71_17845 [Cyanobacteria bacterium J06632_22]
MPLIPVFVFAAVLFLWSRSILSSPKPPQPEPDKELVQVIRRLLDEK